MVECCLRFQIMANLFVLHVYFLTTVCVCEREREGIEDIERGVERERERGG